MTGAKLQPLRVLIVEDSPDDAELLQRELRARGYLLHALRVDTLEELERELKANPWDLVISDFSLIGFTAIEALATLKASELDLPFIILSGSVGEETAVEAMKAGAHDFFLKDRLTRLGSAVDRELREAQIRRERRDALGELQQALRARDEFLSIASHELKTPIAALELQIASGLQLLRAKGMTEHSSPKLESKMEGASRQIDRLTALVNNLLEVTRSTSGERLFLARKSIDLRDVVQATLTRLHAFIERSGSEIVLRAPAPVVGSWDPGGLDTVTGNLIANALKYGEGKPIELVVEQAGDVARFVITDRGLGIDPEDQRRIFERFERAVPSRHYGGLGLGLWIARNIVDAHEGVIRVASRKGHGSTFHIELPLQPSKGPA